MHEMPLITRHRRVQTNAHLKQRQYIYCHDQVGHVVPGHAVLVSVCIFMLSMLGVAENVHLRTAEYMNLIHVHQCHMTFRCVTLLLPSVNNILPAMTLQNRVVGSNISCPASYTSNCYASPNTSPVTSLSGLVRVVGMVLMALLLLMSGDIELNPGPVGDKLTVDDLSQVFEDISEVSAQWYTLGIHLKVTTGTLDSIQIQFSDPKRQLLEMLKTWLKTSDNTSWKTLTDALRSQSMGASHLVGILETKYCLLKGTSSTIVSDSTSPNTPPTPQTPTGVSGMIHIPPANKENRVTSTAVLQSRAEPEDDPQSFTANSAANSHIFQHSYTDVYSKVKADSSLTEPFQGLDTYEDRLICETRDIQGKFNVLFTLVRRSLVNITVDDLVLFLEGVPGYEGKPLFDAEISDLHQATNLTCVFRIIGCRCSWFNHSFLEDIIKAYCKDSKDVRKAYQDYHAHLQKYCKNRVKECPIPNGFGRGGKKDKKIVMKVDRNWMEIQLDQLEEVVFNLSRILNVERHTLHLCCAEKGCVQLTFLVPSYIPNALFPLTTEQEAAMMEMGVIHLQCESYHFPSLTHFEERLDKGSDVDIDQLHISEGIHEQSDNIKSQRSKEKKAKTKNTTTLEDTGFLAFRQLIYNFSQKLSREECQAIVYIRLYECREQYRDASVLDVLSKLEMCGVFSPSNSAGLINVAKDINRSDLVNLVKDYIKSQRSKEKKAKAKNTTTLEDTGFHSELSDEEMIQLRATAEVTLSQASVLAQQVDILQRAIVSKQRQTATETNKKAGRAVKELSEHLRKVSEALERGTSPQSSTSYSSEEGACVPHQATDTTQIPASKLIPKPRQFKEYIQEINSDEDSYEPVQPVRETCNPAQTFDSFLNRTDVVHKDRQQGIPMVDTQTKTMRWTKLAPTRTEYNSSGRSQSAPVSQSLEKDSGRHTQHVKKPAVPPRTRKPASMTPPVPAVRRLPPKVPTKTPVDDSEDYATLCPVINDDDAPTTSGTGDSGYCGEEEWRQHMRYPPTFEGSEEHYYKTLHKETIRDGDYEDLVQH